MSSSSQYTIRFMKERSYFGVSCFSLFSDPPQSRDAPYFLLLLWQSSVVFREFDTPWGLDKELDL